MSVSVWEKESFYSPSDVLIVGSGLLGLWTAKELKVKNPLLKITLIDKSTIPQGASTRNAGFACFGSPTELLHDAKLMPENEMWELVEMRYKGIQKIRTVLGDDFVEYDNCGGYECFSQAQAQEWNEVLEKLEWLNQAMAFITKQKQTFLVADEKLASIGLQAFSHLIENKLEGGIHSGKMVQVLSRLVKGLGVTILSGVQYNSYQEVGEYLQLTTSLPFILKTKKLIFTTNAWLSEQQPQLGVKPARGQVLLSPPIKDFALKGTFHFDGGYYYFRNLGNRFLLGGARNKAFADEETLELATTDIIQTSLFEFIKTHVPAAANFSIEQFESWSGIMAMHPNKQPLLTLVAPNVWAAMCCNGMGVALSPVFAEKVALELVDS
jgi:gamma-glutamylputrescine oxidase